MAEADRLSTTDRENELMARAQTGYERFFAEFSRLTGPPGVGAGAEEAEQLVDKVLTDEVLEPVHEYLDFNEQMVAQTSRQNQAQTDRMALVLLLLGVSGAVAGLLAGFGIARGISRSIVQLSVPIRDAAGKLNEVVGPITVSAGASFEQLEAELRRMSERISMVVERLQRSQREALRAEQLAAVGQFAAGVAHELRNPLMSIKLLLQTANEPDAAGHLSGRDLSVLDEAFSRVEKSVQTLLDFARPPKIKRTDFDVSRVIRQTVDLVAPGADLRGVRIVCELPEEPIIIPADIGQVRQVLLNLVLNALDAVHDGGTIWIHSNVAREPAGTDGLDTGFTGAHESTHWLTVRVSDTGGGLPAELGERIFEPFVSTKETGIGLGLSICKRIVEAHGGNIVAANRPDGGAEFSVDPPQYLWVRVRVASSPASGF